MPIQTAATAVNAYFPSDDAPLMGSTPTVMVGMVIITMPFMGTRPSNGSVPRPIQWIPFRPPFRLW